MRHAPPLVVIETHPIQYHAPVYRCLQQFFDIPVSVIYGSDFSIVGYRDQEFGTSFAWDVDLLSGYDSVFLSNATPQASTKKMGRALRSLRPGAVLLVGYSPFFHQAAIYHACNSGVPILFRGETTDHAHPRTTIQMAIRDRALRFFYNRCSKILYVGQRSKSHFTRLKVPEDKLSFSPYCVATEVFQTSEADRANLREPTRMALDIQPGDIVVLFSGKLSDRKGPDLLLSAVNALPAILREKVVVLFLGSGGLEGSLRTTANAYKLRVRFVGFQNQRKLSAFYHAADFFVLPSRHGETWGLVVNEALHHGLPCVVSTAVGCAPDLIEPGVTGEGFECDSADSLNAALIRVLALSESPDFRSACRKKVSGYSIEHAAEGIANAYQSVVRNGSNSVSVRSL